MSWASSRRHVTVHVSVEEGAASEREESSRGKQNSTSTAAKCRMEGALSRAGRPQSRADRLWVRGCLVQSSVTRCSSSPPLKAVSAASPDTWTLPLHPLQTAFVSKQIPGRRGAGALLAGARGSQTALCGRTGPPGSIHPTNSGAKGPESASATGTENARAPEGEKRTGPASLSVCDLMGFTRREE